uniref:WD_REPEATS_REGION domain-containing protein n=1 Tax=Parastrongyloides trichosuri TaxID=131310 RepID=A0A0N4ZPQ2_PARTI
MGLTRDYLKFEASGICNIIASHTGTIHAIDRNECAASACESLNFYNIKQRKRVNRLIRTEKQVTAVAFSHLYNYIAIGYEDGEISLFNKNLPDYEKEKIVFNGHRSAVNCLAFSNDGLMLASGGKDSVVVVWDIVNESGLFKLNGHKNAVTDIKFTKNDCNIITSSKDATVKFWNISSKSCFYMISESSTEVYSLSLLKEDRLLIVGSASVELKVYELNWNYDEIEESKNNIKEPSAKSKKLSELAGGNMVEEEDSQYNLFVTCKKRGALIRQAKKMALQIIPTRDEKLLMVVGNDQIVDVFRIYSDLEAEKRFYKKIKKAKRKFNDGSEEVDDVTLASNISQDVTILISRIGEIKGFSRIKSLSICNRFVKVRNDEDTEDNICYRVFTLQKNNAIVAFDCLFDEKGNTFQSTAVADLNKLGHRNEIHALALTSRNDYIVTGDSDCGYYWNLNNLSTQLTFEHERMRDIVGALFVYNDQYVLFTTKSGIVPQANGHGFITTSSDKKIKFWNFKIIEEFGSKRLTFDMTRELELTDEGTCLAVSNNGKYLVVGLLDNTARIYFYDTLKFFASLYGHSLPITCIDISPDNKLVITGSIDKSVKIWGIDFGDCHKSIFAHDDVVTCVKFSPKLDERLFWSAGKDGKIKQWDADKFNRVQVLNGHNGPVKCLGQSSTGNFIISIASDKSIRLWDLTDEIIVLSEQEELEREKELEAKLLDEEDIIPGDLRENEAEIANRKTMDSIKSYEDIVDALIIAREEKFRVDSEDKYVPHPLIKSYGSKSINHFIIDAISKIKTTHLERAILMVNYDYVKDILNACNRCIGENYQLELCITITNLTNKIHHNYLKNSPEMQKILKEIYKNGKKYLEEITDVVEFNLAALSLWKAEIESRTQIKIFSNTVSGNKTATGPKLRDVALVNVAH